MKNQQGLGSLNLWMVNIDTCAGIGCRHKTHLTWSDKDQYMQRYKPGIGYPWFFYFVFVVVKTWSVRILCIDSCIPSELICLALPSLHLTCCCQKPRFFPAVSWWESHLNFSLCEPKSFLRKGKVTR